MCGIAGVIGEIGDVNRSALQRMMDSMVHRGPDDAGIWQSTPDERGWGAMLGHRRLSILDLSAAGSQPMIDEISGDVVVLNGEIYNYVALRDSFPADGQNFRSTGDTAVMLRLLATKGCESLPDLRGMFAFGFWNRRKRQLTLARDALGIKPLYLARNSNPNGTWSIAFASEVRALLASGLLGKARLDPLAAASVVWNGFMVAPQTAIAGIETLWPGEFRVFDGTGHQVAAEQFWNATVKSNIHPASESDVADALVDSVGLHLASDVPLGVFLSGGIDSSAIANLAQKSAGASINTFTLAFEQAELNEGPIARQIANAIGTKHREIMLTEQAFISQLDRAIDSLDQPSFDGLNSYFMSVAVRDAGFKVALAGTGGDELFGGYPTFRELPKLAMFSQRMKWLPLPIRLSIAKLFTAAKQGAAGSIPQQTRWAKLPDMVCVGDDLLGLYQLAYALFLPSFQKQLLRDDVGSEMISGLPVAMHEWLLTQIAHRDPHSAIGILEQRLFLGERLLRDTDSASMAASIEIRLPMVDQEFFDVVNRLPPVDRFQPLGRKAILRRAGLQGLDPALFERPKSGFEMPYDRWLRAGLGRLMDAAMRDPALIAPTGLQPKAVQRLWQAFLDGAPGVYWSRVWAIYVYMRWCHQHKAYI